MAPWRPAHLARELARARLAHAQTKGLLVSLAQAWPMTAREMEELRELVGRQSSGVRSFLAHTISVFERYLGYVYTVQTNFD